MAEAAEPEVQAEEGIQVPIQLVINHLRDQVGELSVKLATSEGARTVQSQQLQAQRAEIDALAERIAQHESRKSG